MFLDELKKESNMTYTENGAVTYGSTNSECLDLFAAIGALRRESDEEIITRFIRAYTENPDLAMKTLFFARDIRGGLGERRVFRVIFNWLAANEPESVRKNLKYVAEFGRFDDLLSLMGTPCEQEMLQIVKNQFTLDMDDMRKGKSVSLLAKWLPSVNTSSDETKAQGKHVAKALGLSESEYRKALSLLRGRIRIIENHLREKDYTFDYEKQPSRALFKYRKAFNRNDEKRYMTFINAAASGKAKLHADAIAPYELVAPYLTESGYCLTEFGYEHTNSFMKDITPSEKDILNATWASIPDFGNEENVLAVIDTSGSMYIDQKPLPAAVALSLGLYFAEHNRGAFKNCFIEFSARPQLIEIKGDTFADRLRYVASFNEIANTNLEAVFNLILQAAIGGRVPQDELPAKLIIISDMEFDCCMEHASASNFENARAKFESCGYRLPQVIFWNVASRNRQQPVRKNQQGAILVSGATPRIFDMVAGGNLSPYAFMMDVLGSERYAGIVA